MLVLAFDTSQNSCSAAISHKGILLANDFKPMQRGHAESLLPMIEGVRSEADISYEELDLIAVTLGPGTFTGVRVGLAAARALSLALDVSLLGVSTLEVLARAAIFQIVGECSGIIASIDARRGQLYMQAFEASGEAITEPVVDVIGGHMALNLIEPGVIVGSGAKILQTALPDWQINEDIQQVDAAYFSIAAEQWEDRVSVLPPSPIYLRAPDAKISAGSSFSLVKK